MATTAFSYAAAAKRSATFAAQPNAQLASSTAPTPNIATAKDEIQVGKGAPPAPSVSSTELELREAPSSTQGEKSSLKQDFDTTSVQGSIQSSGSAEQSAKPIHESNGLSMRSRRARDDKTSRSTSRTSRSNDGEGRKARKGKKGRSSDKEGEEQGQEQQEVPEAPKPVLVEASVPTVNIWTQRKEAHAAKAKLTPISTTAVAIPTQPTPATATSDAPVKVPQTAASETHAGLTNGVNGDKDNRKTANVPQAGEQPMRRNGPRGSRVPDRVPEKTEKVNGTPPPVTDSALFPDLKSAVVNGEPAKKAQEKADRVEKESVDDSAPGKRPKEKWTTIDFVPSVNWDTPIPPRTKPRAPGRGGTGPPRGGGAAAPSSRPAPSASAGTERPAASNIASGAPKTTDTRPREGSVSARTPALPNIPSKRNSVEVPPSKDVRRSGPLQNAEASESAGNAEAQPAKGRGEFSRPSRADGSKPTGEGRQFSGPSPTSDRESRPSQVPGKGSDFYNKDGTNLAPGQQSYSKPRNPNRSGPYRPPHIAAGSQMGSTYPTNNPSHTGHTPYPPRTGFQSPPYTNGYQYSNPRVSKNRGGSIGQNGPVPPVVGASFTPRISTEPFEMMGHPGHALPPPPLPYTYDAIQVAKAQVEYYLSIDNLCKDTYLRSNMDSQGFVPLLIIAGFKRMRQLNVDVALLRVACAQSELLDYIVGDDDIERLRMRYRWNEFLLPIGERRPEAQNDGPQKFIYRSWHSLDRRFPPPPPGPVHHQSQLMYPAPYGPEDQVFVPGYMGEPMQAPMMNGGDTNGYHHPSSGSQLSANVPEFSPVSATPVVKLEHLTNFRDEDIPALFVVTRPTKHLSDFANHSFEKPQPPNGSREVNSSESSEVPAEDAAASSSTTATNGVHDEHSSDEGYALDGVPYLPFRQQALEERGSAGAGETPKKMKDLYLFWLHFMSKNFNEKMYLEFRQYALEDATQEVPRKFGLEQLLQYYDLLSDEQQRKPWASEVQTTPYIINMHATEARDLALRPSPVVEN